MSARNFVRENGMWIAVVALVGAGAFLYINSRGNGFNPPKNAYFVDEETGEESIRPVSDVPPLAGKSGKPTVVGVFKYSVDGGKTVKTGYYFKYTDETKKKLEEAIAKGGEVDANPGKLVRSPAAGSKWVSMGSAEGQSATNIDIPANSDVRVMSP